MAKSTVEILGGQLDGTILNNMASEATLREIVSAMKGINSATGGGSGGSGGSAAATRAARERAAKSNLVNKALDGLGNQLGNAIGAVASMGALVASGNVKLSSYTRTLNDQVIAKLPIVGGLLGGVGNVINDSIGILESWNDSLRGATGIGASFGNSIIRASKAATGAQMDIDEFIGIIRQNAPAMLGLGKTVSEGAEKFSRVSNKLVGQGGRANSTLIQMGMKVDGVNSALLNFLDATGMGVSNKSDDVLAESFETYQLGLMRLTSLTGKSVKQIEDQMAVASKDTVFRLKLAKMEPEERAKMLAGLADITARYGETGADLYKSLFLGFPSQNEDTQNLMVLMPHLVKDIRQLQSIAQDRNIKADKFSEQADDIMISTIMKSIKSVNSLDGLLVAAAAGSKEAEQLKKSIDPIMKQLVQFGDVAKLDEAALRAMYKGARKEQTDRDDLTRFINDFETFARNLKYNIMTVLYPMLVEIGQIAKDEDLPGKLKGFGTALAKTVGTYLPKVVTFFRYLGSSSGRDYILNEVGYFFERMGIHFRYYVKEFFRPEKGGQYAKDRDTELAKAEADYTKSRAAIEAKGLPETYTGPTREEAGGSDTQSKQKKSTAEAAKIIAKSNELIESFKKQNVSLGRPMSGDMKVTDTFGAVSALRNWRPHTGTDYSTGGRTGRPIYAANSGILTYKPNTPDGGNLIKIHDPKTGITTVYAHLDPSTAARVKEIGKEVKEGAHIGFSGNTGSSTAPHLHFSAFDKDGNPFDAHQIMKKNSSGTLGNYGKLFRNYGTGEAVQLDGTEAVMTPEQMDSVMKSSGAVNVSELLASLDQNFERLFSLESEKTLLISKQLTEHERLKNNLAA